MLSESGRASLAEWIAIHLTPDHLDRVIPAHHPVRWWHPEFNNAGNTGNLVDIMVDGGHLTLLAALVLSYPDQVQTPLSPDVATELAKALIDLDTEQIQANAHRQKGDPEDVFVCYAHEDAPAVDLICAALRAGGLSVFRDTDCIPPGASIASSVAHSASVAHSVLVVISGASNSSHWVRHEITQVKSRWSMGKSRLYPVVIEDVPIPDAVKDVYSIDLRELAICADLSVVESRLAPVIHEIRKRKDGS